MEKLSDHLYIEPMGQIIAQRKSAEDAERKKRRQRRSYAASRINNQNANWSTQPTGANWEQRESQDSLRARSRQASKDNGVVKNLWTIMQSNVIGHKGIRLQCRASFGEGRLKVDLNKRIEDAWRDWGHAETCTLSGKLSWKGVQKLVLRQALCDGEFLVQMIEDVTNPYGFSLKVWDVNWLDTTFNETPPGRNRIIMSVEVDDNDKPVAYWLTQPPTETTFRQEARRRVRITADQMIHSGPICMDESQTRFAPWLHAGLLNAKNMQGYEQGVIQSARMAGNVFGFIEQDVSDGSEEWTGPESDDGTVKQPTVDVRNLGMTFLNPGQKFSQIDPKQPTQNHSAFMKTEGIHFGASVSVPYFLLFGDWEATNFSSSRGGLGEAKQIWKDLQEFVAEKLCRRIFHEWLKRAWLYGKIEMTAGNYQELHNPKWIPRGWDYIDPTKDAAADVLRLQNRLITPSEILTERGEDYNEFLDRWAADRELAAARGIDIDEIYAPKQAAADPPPPEDTDPPDEPKKPDDAED